jgi:ribonuclease-3
MLRRATTPLEHSLGYRFKRPELLQQALTHSTFANEHPGEGESNERLEFLGDAVLGLLVGRIIFDAAAVADEGELSRRRASIVRREALAALARELALGDALRLGQGQRNATATADSTLADAYEALAGAVFLDGGFDAVERCFGPRLGAAVAAGSGKSDYKTALQELCHARGLPTPTYAVLGVTGPDHARVYRCTVRIGDDVRGEGEGSSKKIAEQFCAHEALNALGAEEGS